FRTFEADELDGANPFGAYAQAAGLLFYFSYDIPRDRFVPWRTDGTAAGTFRLTDEGFERCCARQEMEAVGGTVFFDLRDAEHGDGTPAGTRKIHDRSAGFAETRPVFQGR